MVYVRPITHQASRFHESREDSDCRQTLLNREFRKLLSIGIDERPLHDYHGVSPSPPGRVEGRQKFVRTPNGADVKAHAERASKGFGRPQLGRLQAGISERCDPRHAREEFFEHLEALTVHLPGVEKDACDVATRAPEA